MNGRKRLAAYLKKTGESQRSLERRIKVQSGAICHYLKGDRRPEGRIAFALELATLGDVPLWSWWARKKPAVAA